MRVTTSCINCGGNKGHGNLLAAYCTECFSAMEGAKAAASASQEDPSTAARRALSERAFGRRNSFVDPRFFNRVDAWKNGNRPT